MDKVLTRLIQTFLVCLVLYMVGKSAIAPPACMMLITGDCIAS